MEVSKSEVANIIQTQLFKAFENQENYETFKNSNKLTSCANYKMCGATTSNLIANIVALQQMIIDEAKFVGVSVKPFIEEF